MIMMHDQRHALTCRPHLPLFTVITTLHHRRDHRLQTLVDYMTALIPVAIKYDRGDESNLPEAMMVRINSSEDMYDTVDIVTTWMGALDSTSWACEVGGDAVRAVILNAAGVNEHAADRATRNSSLTFLGLACEHVSKTSPLFATLLDRVIAAARAAVLQEGAYAGADAGVRGEALNAFEYALDVVLSIQEVKQMEAVLPKVLSTADLPRFRAFWDAIVPLACNPGVAIGFPGGTLSQSEVKLQAAAFAVRAR